MKKFVGGIVATFFTTTILTTSASALLKVVETPDPGVISGQVSWIATLYNDGSDSNYHTTDYGIDYSAVDGVRFTIAIDKNDSNVGDMWLSFFEGDIGGEIALMCHGGDIQQYENPDDPNSETTDVWNSYSWAAQSWYGCEYVNESGETVDTNPNTNDDDPTNDHPVSAVNLGDYTYELTATGFANPLSCETDGWEINEIGTMNVILWEKSINPVPMEVLKCEVLDADGKVLLWFDSNGKPSLTNVAPDEPEPEPELTIDSTLPIVNLHDIDGTSKNAIALSWSTAPRGCGYYIESYIDGKWRKVGEILDSLSTTSYIVDGLTDSTFYKFRVRTISKENGEYCYSEPSEERAACTIPDKITGAEVTKTTANSITLSWDKYERADGYIIYVYAPRDGYIYHDLVATVEGADTTTYTITGLSPSTDYQYRIHAYKVGARGGKSTGTGYTIHGITCPSAVKGLSLGGRSGSALRLNWTKNDTADGYIIEMYKGGKWTRIARIAGNSTTTYRVTGLAAGTAYKFRMRAYKSDGTKAYYSEYTSTLAARTNPSVVTGLKIGGKASNALRLNWTKNTSADGYIIEQYKSGKWVRVARIAGNSTTTYRVTGLAASTQYKFRVKAYKMSGSTALYSGYTSTLAAYTNPSAVSNLKITGKAGTALRLGWSKNTSADGYIVEMYSGGKWVRVAKVTSNATVTYRKAGLKKGTTYKFRVATYNVAGGTAYYGAYVNVSGTTNK